MIWDDRCRHCNAVLPAHYATCPTQHYVLNPNPSYTNYPPGDYRVVDGRMYKIEGGIPPAWRDEEIDRLRDLLKQAAAELTEYVDAEHIDRHRYPDIQRRYERDMCLVREINFALGTNRGRSGD